MTDILFRSLRPADYDRVISVVDEWWGGRQVAALLPRLFFHHFCRTSFAAEADGRVVGFVVGFMSPMHRREAYIHFVGVDPNFRGRGIGRQLYLRFFELAGRHEAEVVHSVTSPTNRDSIAFHTRMGFTMGPGDVSEEGIPAIEDYDGPGAARVLFTKQLRAT